MTGIETAPDDAVDHVGVAHPRDAALGADVGGHPLERHDRDGAGVLGDLRLLRGDDVHDHAALELLGHAALDAVGARGGGRGGVVLRCHGLLPRVRRGGPRRAPGVRVPTVDGTAGAGAGRPSVRGHVVEPVVDVEEARQRAAAVQPQQPGQPAAAQRAGVADGVVVEPPGQPDPGRGPRRSAATSPGRRPARRAGPAAPGRGRSRPARGRRPPGRGRRRPRGQPLRGPVPTTAPACCRARSSARPARRCSWASSAVQARSTRCSRRRSRTSVHAVQASSRSSTTPRRPAARHPSSRGKASADGRAGAPGAAGTPALGRVLVGGGDRGAAGAHHRLVDREDPPGDHRPVVAGGHLARRRGDSRARRPGRPSRSASARPARRRRRGGPARRPRRLQHPRRTRRGRWPRSARRPPSPRCRTMPKRLAEQCSARSRRRPSAGTPPCRPRSARRARRRAVAQVAASRSRSVVVVAPAGDQQPRARVPARRRCAARPAAPACPCAARRSGRGSRSSAVDARG